MSYSDERLRWEPGLRDDLDLMLGDLVLGWVFPSKGEGHDGEWCWGRGSMGLPGYAADREAAKAALLAACLPVTS